MYTVVTTDHKVFNVTMYQDKDGNDIDLTELLVDGCDYNRAVSAYEVDCTADELSDWLEDWRTYQDDASVYMDPDELMPYRYYTIEEEDEIVFVWDVDQYRSVAKMVELAAEVYRTFNTDLSDVAREAWAGYVEVGSKAVGLRREV